MSSVQGRLNRLSQTVIAEAQRERDAAIHTLERWILGLGDEERELWHRWFHNNESINSMTQLEQALLTKSAEGMPDGLLAELIVTHHRLAALHVPGY